MNNANRRLRYCLLATSLFWINANRRLRHCLCDQTKWVSFPEVAVPIGLEPDRNPIISILRYDLELGEDAIGKTLKELADWATN